jgi:hypothetical protein
LRTFSGPVSPPDHTAIDTGHHGLSIGTVETDGEAGVGYVLEAGLDLPPLMLTQYEIDVAILGAQWVTRHSDPILARAAEDLIAKIGAVVPERLRPYVLKPATGTREPDSTLPIFGVGFYCACSAVGHPPIAPASKARKSRRLITQPRS